MIRVSRLLILPLAISTAYVGLGTASTPSAPDFVAAAAAQSDDGSKPKRNTKRVDSLRQRVYEDIAEAQEALEEGNKAEAVEDLSDLMEDDLNDYETAIVRQLFAQVAIDEEDYDRALSEYEKITQLERVPDSIFIQALYSLAQLYFIDEQYRKSIEYMNRWLNYSEKPGPTPYTFLGQAYYALEQFDEAVPQIEKAIEIAKQQGLEIKENWYLLLRSAYFELQAYEKVREVLELLAVNWDKPEYWRQLSAVYSELGLEKKQLSTMEVAYRRGFLDRENHLINLAQLYMVNNVPIKAAWVLEEGLKDGVIEKTPDNYKLLGQAYQNAQEAAESEEPFRLAAEKADEGELWMRLGQVRTELEDYAGALTALRNALDAEEELDEPGYAHLLIGMAHFNRDELADAKQAFRQAARFDETEKQARQWISYVDSEQKRRRELDAYYGGGGQ